jgi:hypothetical protein
MHKLENALEKKVYQLLCNNYSFWFHHNHNHAKIIINVEFKTTSMWRLKTTPIEISKGHFIRRIHLNKKPINISTIKSSAISYFVENSLVKL